MRAEETATLSSSFWRSVLLRFCVGSLLGIAAGLASPFLAFSQALLELGLQATAVGGAAMLFGPAALVGSILGLGVTGGLERTLLDATAWLVLGASLYLAFRTLPGIGRSLPNLRSYTVLLVAAALGSALAAPLATFGRYGSSSLLAAWIWGASRFTSLVVVLPPLVLLTTRVAGRWLLPVPGEVPAPAAREATAASTDDLWTRAPDEGSTSVGTTRSALFIGLTVVGIAALSMAAPQAGPWSWSWLGLLYVVPVLLAAFRFGLAGGVLAASAAGLAFLLANLVLAGAEPSRASHEQNLAVFSYLLLLSVIGATTGALRDRHANLRRSLRESEERFRVLCEATFEGIAISEGGRVLDANRQLSAMLGREPSELIGAEISDFVAPESRELVKEKLQRNLELPYEHQALRKDGTEFPVEVHARTVPYHDRMVRVTAIRDISDWKATQTALQESRDQLRQSQRLEAIGRLAGGIAHDFNNLLTVIGGYTQLILDSLPADDDRRPAAIEVARASDRASSLVRQLLAFSRKQVLEPRIVNLNTVVSEIRTMLRRLIGEDIELATSLDPELGLVEIDPRQLEQVIMNVAVNARDAMPRGGRFGIETWNTELDRDGVDAVGGLAPGAYVGMTLSDTGIGMDEETQTMIFEPFFTTKERDKGTGLGLSTVYGIVTQSGGAITVSSTPGSGTSFRIYLPRAADAADSARRGAEAR